MEQKIINKIKFLHSEYGTNKSFSFYLYDLADIALRIKKIRENSPLNLGLYYAMKANPNSSVMKFISNQEGIDGVEIASDGEMHKAMQYFSTNKILFTGPGKTDFELKQAAQHKIRLINVESLTEIIRLEKIAKELHIDNVDILLRINIDYVVEDALEYMAGSSTKMGIDEKQILSVYKYIKNSIDTLTVKGIHVFSASGVMKYKKLIKYAHYIFKLVKKIETHLGLKIHIIDFGGGLGIDYDKGTTQFDVENYMLELKSLIDSFGYHDKELILELGTYLVGSCGYYSTKVIDIKEVKNYKYVIVAGGVNHLRLPIANGRKHPVEVIRMDENKYYEAQPSVFNEKVDIGGPLCMDADKLSWDVYLDYVDIGDIVVVKQAGAYGYTASTLEFLSHELPKEVVIS